jgi:hypothetical protein
MPAVIGEYLDRAVTIEMRFRDAPRGVIAGLYDAARREAGGPLTLKAARGLLKAAASGRPVMICTGAGIPVWLPKGETDGPVGAASLARALATGCGVNTLFLSSEAHRDPIAASAQAAGLAILPFEQARQRHHAGTMVTLPTEPYAATVRRARTVLRRYQPSAVVAIEAKGPTKRGTLHYITGKEVPSEGEARLDALVAEARRAGIYTVGIGDAGNEIGCGRIRRAVERIHPNGPIIATVAETDALVIAATSNWGAYGVAAMLAFLLGAPDVLHSPEMGRRMLEASVQAGAGDGLHLVPLPMEDGQPVEVHMALVTILDRIVRNGLSEIKRGIHIGLKVDSPARPSGRGARSGRGRDRRPRGGVR